MTDESSMAPTHPSPLAAGRGQVLDEVAGAIARLKYGIVQLTIHDGKVVQLDVTDRLRFR